MNKTMNHQYLAIGQKVLVIAHDGKPHEAKIVKVIHEHAAHVESPDGQHSAVAEFSDQKEIGTFHFPSTVEAAGSAAGKAGITPAPTEKK